MKTDQSDQGNLLTSTPDVFGEFVKDCMNSLLTRRYWKPTLKAFENKLEEIKKDMNVPEKQAAIIILDYLAEILENSEPAVMRLIKRGGKDVK